MRRSWYALVVVTWVVGCGASDEEKACEDLSEAVGNAAERCQPGAGAATRAELERQLGGCDNIDNIRDEDSLYATCIPSLETIECSDLTSGNLDPSCLDQLQIYR